MRIEASMDSSPEALQEEVRRLRTEIQQLREIVNALFNAVFEESDEEWEAVPNRDDHHMYN